MLFFSQMFGFQNFNWYITSNTYLFTTILLFAILIENVRELWLFYRWCRKTKENLTMGLGLAPITHEEVKRHHKIRKILIMIMIAIFLIPIVIAAFMGERSLVFSGGLAIFMIALSVTVAVFIQRKKWDREVNIMVIILEVFVIAAFWGGAIIWFVTHNKEPQQTSRFIIEDFGINEQGMMGEESASKSLFAEEITGEFIPKADTDAEQTYVYYKIFKSKNSWVMEKYLQWVMEEDFGRGGSYKPIQETAWGAKQVYCSSKWTEKILVVYPNCIFTYETDNLLSQKNIKGIIEKLQLQEK